MASRDDGKAPFMSGLVTYVCGTPGWIFFLEPSATLSREPSLPLNALSSSRQNTPWPALVSTRHVRQAPEPSTGVPSSSPGDLVWKRASSASLYTPVPIFSTISIVLSHLSKLASFVSAFCLVLIAATRAARFAVFGGERVPTRAMRWSGANSPRRLPFNASVWSVASIRGSSSHSFFGAGISFRNSSTGIRSMHSSPALKVRSREPA